MMGLPPIDTSPEACPVVREARRARRRAAELGIKTSKGVLLYIAERLQARATMETRELYSIDQSSKSMLDAAAECIAIAGMEP